MIDRESKKRALTVEERRLALAATLLATATILAYAGVPTPVAFAVLGAGALALWTLSVDANVAGYLLTLAFQVFQSLVLFRVAMSDFFMMPAAVKSHIDARRKGEPWPQSTLWLPFALLLGVMAMGNVTGLLETRRLSGYVLVNKDLGILYLLAGFYTLLRYLKSRKAVERAAHWFVIGVSVANVTALAGVPLASAGIQNDLYLIGNLRLYGWMLNPTLFGGILLTAAMVELGLLAQLPSHTHLRTLRWLNVWLLTISTGLTISRGTWLAGAIAGAVLFLLQITLLPRRPNAMQLVATAAWIVLPLLAFGNVISMSSASLSVGGSRAHAEELQYRLVSQCKRDPTLDICASVLMPTVTPSTAVALPPQPTVTPSTAVASPPQVVASTAIDNAMTNARGLQDRVAIMDIAARDYLRSGRRMLFGIGLGTFFATSAADFGVPLIIHNTFAWFLVEMGPIGLLVVLWIWARTWRNLWNACMANDWRVPLAIGLTAAFAGLTVWCVLNEGFYQRHLWLVLVLADRLGGVPLFNEGQSPEHAPEAVTTMMA